MTGSVDDPSLVAPDANRVAVGEEALHLRRGGLAEAEPRGLAGEGPDEGLVASVDLEGCAGRFPQRLDPEDVVDVAVGGEDAPDPEVREREPEHAAGLAARVDHEGVPGLRVGDEPGVLGEGADDRLANDQQR